MRILGITGSIGSGKTTVARFLRGKGARVLDADKMAHALLAPSARCFARIKACFGAQVLTRGRLDRRKLAGIVFNDPESLRKLCAIIHPEVTRQIKAQITRCRAKRDRFFLIIDAPLLFEAGLEALCDHVVVVRATKEVQIKRIQKKGDLTREEILKRMKAQMPLRQKIARADFVIDNQGPINQTKKQVEALWQRLKKTEK